jgi:hypothetical protein
LLIILIITSSVQFNSIYLCAKLNSPEANYKVSTGKKMGRVRRKKESENNVLINIKIIIIIILIRYIGYDIDYTV